jgi:hypothetical protein
MSRRLPEDPFDEFVHPHLLEHRVILTSATFVLNRIDRREIGPKNVD